MFPDFQIPLYFVTISKYVVNNLFLGHTKVHTKMHFRDSQASSQSTQQKLHWEEKLAEPREKMIEMKTRKVGKKGCRVGCCSSCSRCSLILLILASWCSGIFFATIKGPVLIWKQWLRMEQGFSAQEASLDPREKPLSEEEFNSVKKCRCFKVQTHFCSLD